MNALKVEIKVEIPDWVNWMAVDESGEVWAFEEEPFMDGTIWTCGLEGKAEELYQSKPPKNWKDELYEWK